MAKPKTELAKAKSGCWAAFSTFIRTRDCLRFKNSLEAGVCVTCNREYPYKRLVAGHFIPGRTNSILFNEDIVYTQCWGCNTNPPYGLGGNYVEYFVFMENEWGRAKIDEFRALKMRAVKYTVAELINMRAAYIERTESLKNEYYDQLKLI